MEIDWKDEILYKELVMWDSRLKREAPFFQDLLSNLQNKDARILDVACGTGDHMIMFTKWGFTGKGIDISEQNIEQAKILAQKNKCDDKVEFLLGEILELESYFPDEKFDFIYCIGNTLSIFDKKERDSIINQMLNLLNDKGVVIIQAVNYLSHKNDEQWFYNPSLKRTADGALLFHIRMMEWKSKFDKITMYVHKIFQTEKGSEEFDLAKKRTEFFIISKDDFTEYDAKEIKVNIYGDYKNSNYIEEKSNDLVIILEKR
jgi:SAM-dependent methyltransferase